MGPQCPAGNVTVVVSTIYIQSVRYSALEVLCYLDTVECCSPDTPPAIPHRRWGWSSLLSSSSCVSEFGSLWSTAGNSWTTFPRIPIGHLVAGMKFGHLSSLSLQPKLATNIKHILFSILESKQGKQITLKNIQVDHNICHNLLNESEIFSEFKSETRYCMVLLLSSAASLLWNNN